MDIIEGRTEAMYIKEIEHRDTYYLQVYQHIAGIELHPVKRFKICHTDSRFYQSDKADAYDRAITWVEKQ